MKKILSLLVICLIICGCTNTSKTTSSSISLKYNGSTVEEIEISSSTTDFSVVGSSIGESLDYKIVINSKISDNLSSKVKLHELDSNDNIVSTNDYLLNQENEIIYEGTIISGEVAYGKRFRLSFPTFDTTNVFKIIIVK